MKTKGTQANCAENHVLSRRKTKILSDCMHSEVVKLVTRIAPRRFSLGVRHPPNRYQRGCSERQAPG